MELSALRQEGIGIAGVDTLTVPGTGNGLDNKQAQ